MKVKLQDIIDGMEMQFEGMYTYLNLKTGKVISVSEENFRAAEEEASFEHFPEWRQEELKVALDVLMNFGEYKELPTKCEINEYEMIEGFLCFS